MQQRLPVIAIAGLGCETSTFSPARTLASAFHPRRGEQILQQYYSWLAPTTELGVRADWRGILIGHALPGGIVTRAAFEELASEIVNGLTALVATTRLDGLWYDIHGAMCVEGIDDSEGELLRRMRAVVGPDVLVSASMDLHGNVSRQLAHQTDLISCFRTAPHIDVTETKQRACVNLVNLLNLRRQSHPTSPLRPFKAWIPIPVLLPGEQTSTRMEPAAHIYAAVPEIEALDGVIDAAIWVGYCWADEPRNRAVVVVTGWDQNAVKQGAEKLARKFWDAHRDFRFVAPTGSFATCLAAACSSSARPYFISDSGDNPTAGGAGDVTWTLHELLRWSAENPTGPRVVYASIPGGEDAVQAAQQAGVGGIVTVSVGAAVDNVHAAPVQLTNAQVHAIKTGDRDALVEVVLQVRNIWVIVTQLRKPYHKEHDFTDLDINPRHGDVDIVIVKIGYLEPELYDMAADWMLALTPGGVDQDLERLRHRRIRRPMWPYDKSWTTSPDLHARFIASSNEPLTGADE